MGIDGVTAPPPRLGGRFLWPLDQFRHFGGLTVTPYHYQPHISARIVMWTVHPPPPTASSVPPRLLSAKTSVPSSPWTGRDSPQHQTSESVLSTVERRKALGNHHHRYGCTFTKLRAQEMRLPRQAQSDNASPDRDIPPSPGVTHESFLMYCSAILFTREREYLPLAHKNTSIRY